METNGSTEQIDRTGTVIDDRFAVERLIARGGFSAVYRARRVYDGETVAIKVLELGPDTEANAMERFTREAQFVRGLSSPNTIRIHETGQVGTEFLFTVMEYIKGRSLLSQLRRRGPLNGRQTAEVTVQLCNALMEVHEQGLLHRDLKPSNIMLFRDEDGHVRVKLLDFGVAKIVDPGTHDAIKLTAAGAFIGTPRYASPEQMRREPLSSASDVYAVGLIMWEMLTGEPAVPETDYSSCVRAHISPDEWRLPRDCGYPADMIRIVERSTAKDKDQRFQSCGALKRALQHYLSNRSVRSASDSGPQRTTRLNSDNG